MKRVILQLIVLFFTGFLILGGFLFVKKLLALPFRPTNDALHQTDSAFNLDFLIPAGTYIDERVTIGEVVRIRFTKKKTIYRQWMESLFGLVPYKYRYVANLVLFSFWLFCFMIFLRVFTFIGYGRALRGSLLLAGITYYFMPDFSAGRWDDALALAAPVSIVALRRYLVHRRKKPDGLKVAASR
jgi:hypothetical protein